MAPFVRLLLLRLTLFVQISWCRSDVLGRLLKLQVRGQDPFEVLAILHLMVNFFFLCRGRRQHAHLSMRPLIMTRSCLFFHSCRWLYDAANSIAELQQR